METPKWHLRENTLDVIPGLMPPMDAPVPYWTKQVLQPEEADAVFYSVISRYGKHQLSQVYAGDGVGAHVDLNTRYTHYFSPSWIPEGRAVEARFNEAASECAAEWWGLSATPVYEAQILGYEERCRFRTHADNSIYTVNGWSRNDPLRDLTAILYLGDHVQNVVSPNQFSGGELVLENLMTSDGLPVVIRPKKGQLVAFPSHPVFRHQVPLITRGYRIAFVNWWTVR